MMDAPRVLVVDDSRLSRRRFLAQPLRTVGYDVLEACDGKQGLAVFDEGKPDLIISDLLMPVMDGFEFITALRQRSITQPIIVASADIQASTRRRLDELEIDGFLNKPYTADELLHLVGQALSFSPVGG